MVNKCGREGKVCDDPNKYLRCSEMTESEGVEFVSVPFMSEKGVEPQRFPVEVFAKFAKSRDKNFSTARQLLVPTGFEDIKKSIETFEVERSGNVGTCWERIPELPKPVWMMFGNEGSANAGMLTFYNYKKMPDHAGVAFKQLTITAEEMFALANSEELSISYTDVAMIKAPNVAKEGNFSAKGKYSFIGDPARLNQIIDTLKSKDVEIEDLDDENRKMLIAELESLRDGLPMSVQEKLMTRQMLMMAALNLLSLAVTYKIMSSMVTKQIAAQMKMMERQLEEMRKMQEGKDQTKLEDFTKDLVAEQAELMSRNEAPEIVGRDADAYQYLEYLVRGEYANPLLIGESGVGKDMIVRRAAQLIALKDPRAMDTLNRNEQTKKALEEGTFKLLWIDTTAYQAGTKFRGSVAERLKLILDAMQKDGVFVYLEEMADFLSAGVAAGAESEGLASQLKSVLTRPTSHWSGSTTLAGYQKLLTFNDDFKRRLPQINVNSLQVAVVRQFAQGYAGRAAKPYGATYADGVVDAAVTLAVKYRHLELGSPLVDAVKQTLIRSVELAAGEARTNGNEAQVKVELKHVLGAIEEQMKHAIPEEDAFESRNWDEEIARRSAERAARKAGGGFAPVGATRTKAEVVAWQIRERMQLDAMECLPEAADMLRSDPAFRAEVSYVVGEWVQHVTAMGSERALEYLKGMEEAGFPVETGALPDNFLDNARARFAAISQQAAFARMGREGRAPSAGRQPAGAELVTPSGAAVEARPPAPEAPPSPSRPAPTPTISEAEVRAQLEAAGTFKDRSLEHQDRIVRGFEIYLKDPRVASAIVRDGRLTERGIRAVMERMGEAVARPVAPEAPKETERPAGKEGEGRESRFGQRGRWRPGTPAGK